MLPSTSTLENIENLSGKIVALIIIYTRSYAALRAADLDWIVGPGYNSGGYILEKFHEKPTWNHENQPGSMKNHETNQEPLITNLEP